MKKQKRIAFYAPIKPPDDPIPSGDRLIAKNLMAAFKLSGHEAVLASKYKCYSKHSDLAVLEERKSGAMKEVARLLEYFSGLPKSSHPQIWVSYHPYCKAPDWIGPAVSKGLDIPYVTIEAARTNQGQNNEWEPWRREAQSGLKCAVRHLCFKPSDKAYLSQLLGSEETIFDIPPFIDTGSGGDPPAVEYPNSWSRDTPVLVTAGMMRKGKKDKNYYLLAEALNSIKDQNWNLVVVGGGPEESAIRSAFSNIEEDRIHWCGQVNPEEVVTWMQYGDIFVWPGWKEPIGMVFLEAQLQGLPVVAFSSMGVPLVVEDRKTGLLSEEGDLAGFSTNVVLLLGDRARRKKMGAEARLKVVNNHTVKAAAERLNECIGDL